MINHWYLISDKLSLHLIQLEGLRDVKVDVVFAFHKTPDASSSGENSREEGGESAEDGRAACKINVIWIPMESPNLVPFSATHTANSPSCTHHTPLHCTIRFGSWTRSVWWPPDRRYWPWLVWQPSCSTSRKPLASSILGTTSEISEAIDPWWFAQSW